MHHNDRTWRKECWPWQRPRIYYTEVQKAMMWDRWSKGETLHQIGKLIDHISPFRNTCRNRRNPLASAPSVPIGTDLTSARRSRELWQGESIYCVAASLGRAASVSRESPQRWQDSVTGLLGPTKLPGSVHYSPQALQAGEQSSPGNKIVKANRSINGRRNRSQGWLKTDLPGEGDLQLSHEAIYRTLLSRRGCLEEAEHLRRTRGMRRSRHYTQKTSIHGRIVDAVPIAERPAYIEDRYVPGHWEGDLLFGDAHSQIAPGSDTRAA